MRFVWQVGDTSVAEFDSSTGLLRAKKLGSTTVGFTVKGFLPKLPQKIFFITTNAGVCGEHTEHKRIRP